MKKSLLKFFLIAIVLIISFSVLSACNNVDFKIEFIVDGEVYATVSTNGSETIKMPEDPEKKGYSFDGWFWDEGVWKKPFTVNSLLENPLSENMKVYAKWIEESKASDFSVSGFEKTDDNVFCKVVDNETKSMSFSDIVEADPSAEWVLTSDIGGKDVIPSKMVSLSEGDNKFYVMVTDADDKVSVYEINVRRKFMYTVTFDTDGGEEVEPQKVQEGDYVLIPETAKKGYKLIGWSKDLTQAVTDNVYVKAIWEAKTYTAALDAAGGNVHPDRVTVTFDNTFELPTPDRKGYKFIGWQNAEGQETDRIWSYDKDLTFTAVWSEIKDEYTYNSYTLVSPEDWNELTYREDSEAQIIDYINSPLFEFDYKYDDDGNIVPGGFDVKYSAATMLEDVTARYAGRYGLNADDKGYVWKITLREDLVWDDGNTITAADFVYSMKEQLSPLFRNYRASSYYDGNLIIRNAKGYAKQGLVLNETLSEIFASVSEANAAGYNEIYLDLTAVEKLFYDYGFGIYSEAKQSGVTDLYFTIYYENGETSGQSFFDKYDIGAAANGQILVTQEMIDDFDRCYDWKNVSANGIADICVINSYAYPSLSFEDVGIFEGNNDYELIICLEKPMNLLKNDGTLSYIAGSEFSLPLVKRDIYEMCKKAPVADNGVWTTDYNTSVEKSASWGPYKLTEFVQGEKYVLERNENWYGYTAGIYEGQYQTDRIVCVTCEDWDEALLKFNKGEIDNLALSDTAAKDFYTSERIYHTSDNFVNFLNLQSDEQALKAREKTGINKTILTYKDFRKAISLGIDRAAYVYSSVADALPGFGLMSDSYYYDVDNGLAYRRSEEAKMALIRAYGVDVSEFGSLDEAVDSITGYDLAQAKALVNSAYNQAIADGKLKATDTVQLVWGAPGDNPTNLNEFLFVSHAMTELMKGTPLEGKFSMLFDSSYGGALLKDFRNGKFDICSAGWTGEVNDPAGLINAHLDPEYMYSYAWDTSSQMMTFTMPVKQSDGTTKDTELTMSLLDWCYCLNGIGDCAYDWSANSVSPEVRLPLIAALEEQVLLSYYSIPMCYDADASLISYKTEYIDDDYNTFLGFGGVRFMTYNYNDGEWDEFVSSQGGYLNYK